MALHADLRLGSADPREALSALASVLIRSLSGDRNSPLYGRIAVPGISPSESQNITIAEAVKGITRSTLFGRVLQKNNIAPGYFCAGTDPKTIKRAGQICNAYFGALMEANVERWNAGRTAYICVNPGVRAHFQLMYEILKYLEVKEGFDPHTAADEEIGQRLMLFVAPITSFVKNAGDQEIANRFALRYGEGGVRTYFYHLCDLLQGEHKGFGPKDFHDERAKQTDIRQERARDDTLDLQAAIVEFVVSQLKKIHGEGVLRSGESVYWSVGIQDAQIKQEVYKKQQMEPPERQAQREAYLELADCLKIVKQTNNWAHFEPVLNIPMPEERGGKKYYLDWLEEINRLRRIAAHKTEFRKFEEDDLKFLEWIKQELYGRFQDVGFEP